MSLKKLNRLVIIQQNEVIKFNKSIKLHEQNLINKINKNSNNYPFKIIKIKRNKIFKIRGSFEKHIVLKNTIDCDVHIYLELTKEWYDKIQNDNYNIKSLKSKFQTFLEQIYGNQIKSISSTKPTIDINLYGNKILSIIPVIFYSEHNKFQTMYVTHDECYLKTTIGWFEISQFNEILQNYSKSKRKKIRVIVRLLKFWLKPSFLNLSFSPLEHYILDYFNKINTEENYFQYLKNILYLIGKNDLINYISNHPKISNWRWLEKNRDAVEQISNRANKINNKIKNYNNLKEVANNFTNIS